MADSSAEPNKTLWRILLEQFWRLEYAYMILDYTFVLLLDFLSNNYIISNNNVITGL